MPSYYFPELNANSQEVLLENEEFHHLCRVKRIGPKARIKLNSGSGLLAEAEVLEISRNHARLRILQANKHLPPKPGFAIAFALLKNHHDELVIEKCTELGAASFFPILTEFTVKEQGRNTVSRFEKIALSAIKQCDNPWLPVVHPVKKLAEALSEINESGYQVLICSETERNRWMRELSADRDFCFVIGPEGGFSPKELAQMSVYPSITISPLIMRAETAAVCAASQFQLLRKGLDA